MTHCENCKHSTHTNIYKNRHGSGTSGLCDECGGIKTVISRSTRVLSLVGQTPTPGPVSGQSNF